MTNKISDYDEKIKELLETRIYNQSEISKMLGINRMSTKNASMCGECYHKSDKFKDMLRNQASRASIAGNKSRWS